MSAMQLGRLRTQGWWEQGLRSKGSQAQDIAECALAQHRCKVTSLELNTGYLTHQAHAVSQLLLGDDMVRSSQCLQIPGHGHLIINNAKTIIWAAALCQTLIFLQSKQSDNC